MAHEEYLRRNLVHAGSIGVTAGIVTAVVRLKRTKRPPKWLVEQLDGLVVRSERASAELAEWRNIAPDRPRSIV